MKAPSIFSCLINLSSHCMLQSNSARLGISDLPPSPAPEEILPSEDLNSKLFSTEPISLPGGIILLKGRISNSEVAGIPSSDLVPGVYEGGLKLSECATDLVDTLRREIQDGQLSFRGKRVLELGCGHGIPGIFACIKGASVVHFQDFNAQVIRRLTIPNVTSNLEYARVRVSRHSGGSLTPTRSLPLAPDVHYYAGDWSDVHSVLSQVEEPAPENNDVSSEFNFDFSSRPSTPVGDRDFSSRPSTPPTPTGDYPSRPSTPTKDPSTPTKEQQEGGNSYFEGRRSRRRSSGSRAFERSRDRSSEQGGGYDVILMSDTVYSSYSLPKLYELLKKCLRPYYGVVYVSAKKHYFGRGGGSRQFKNMIEDDGILGAHLVADFPDGYSSTREVWKFFFR